SQGPHPSGAETGARTVVANGREITFEVVVHFAFERNVTAYMETSPGAKPDEVCRARTRREAEIVRENPYATVVVIANFLSREATWLFCRTRVAGAVSCFRRIVRHHRDHNVFAFYVVHVLDAQ